jgi:hypothetical protein
MKPRRRDISGQFQGPVIGGQGPGLVTENYPHGVAQFGHEPIPEAELLAQVRSLLEDKHAREPGTDDAGGRLQWPQR